MSEFETKDDNKVDEKVDTKVEEKNEEDDTIIRLLAQDGTRDVLKRLFVPLSGFVVEAIENANKKEDDDDDDDDDDEEEEEENGGESSVAGKTGSDGVMEISCPEIRVECLDKVISYCEEYARDPMTNVPKPIPHKRQVKDCVREFYGNFVTDLSYNDLFETLMAAHYLQIEPLLQLTTARVALLIMNKTPEEIFEKFEIDGSDFPKLEYQTLLYENKWSTDPLDGWEAL